MIQYTEITYIFILTVIPIIVVYYFLYFLADGKIDKNFTKFFIFALTGGFLSAITAKHLIYPALEVIIGHNIFYILRDTHNSILFHIILNLCFVGITEEGIKLFYTIVVLVYLQRLSSFRSYFIASICVAAGFCLLENIHYFQFYGLEAINKRATISFAGHLAFSSIAGISMGISIYYSSFRPFRGYFIFLFGFIISALMHATFNVIASSFDIDNAVILIIILLTVATVLVIEGWQKLIKIDKIGAENLLL